MEVWRDWQEKCFTDWIAKGKQDYLIAATPGCGKTKLALRIIKAAFERGDAERVVIVVPTEYLKYQWKEAANDYGINIDPYGTKAQETSEFDGRATTYQAILSGADNYRYGTSKPTIVIFDEIHHAGIGPWGHALQQAFDHAEYRVLLSGTPFRTDQAPIPYVTYVDGVSHPDFEYTYKDALRDKNILKLVNFNHIDGKPEWEIRGDSHSRKISEASGDRSEKNWGLRTAFKIGGDWMNKALKIADTKLETLRMEGRHDTGGIIFVENIICAKLFENNKDIRKMLGENPVVVYSEKKESKDLIERFRESKTQKWIVSVKQISEGVDIPRLAVAVYATIETTELIFRQRIARVLRIEKKYPENVWAFIYIPEDPDIMELAKLIQDECVSVMDEDFVPPEDGAGPGDEKEDSGFIPGDTNDVEVTGVISGGADYNAPYEEALRLANEANVPVENVVKILALVQKGGADVVESSIDSDPNVTKAMADKKIDMKMDEDRRTGSLASKLGNRDPVQIGTWKRSINKALWNVCKKPKAECTIDDLAKRSTALKGWMQNGFKS